MRTALLCASMVLVACGDNDGGGGADPDAGGGGDPDAGAVDADGPMVEVRAMSGPHLTSFALVAYQDGDGPWQVATGEGGIHRFVAWSGRYAVSAVCESYNGDVVIETRRALVSEHPVARIACVPAVPDTMVDVAIAGL